jgi:Na+-driven multidrug efflux pump
VQGGRNFRRKQWRILGGTVAAALIFGLLLALLIWWFSRPMH